MHRVAPGARRLLVAASVAALALALGSASASAAPWVTAPASDASNLLSELFWLTLVLAGVVFVLVEALLIYSSLRFRRRAISRTHEPAQIHGNTRLEVMWAIVPALILIGLFGVSVRTLNALGTTEPADAMHVQVQGRQFTWTFTYPDSGVSTTNELHLPVGKPIVFDVTAVDVIHSFWVPEMHGKIDAIPGKLTHIWWTPDHEGTFRGVCAELCGAGHATMLFTVTAEAQDAFDKWIQDQKSGAASASTAGAAGGDPQVGAQLIVQKGCPACHTIPGIPGANGTVGPNLAGVASRKQLAGGAVTNNGPDDIKRWIMNPPGIKPGTLMPNLGLSDAEATNIVAYLETLK